MIQINKNLKHNKNIGFEERIDYFNRSPQKKNIFFLFKNLILITLSLITFFKIAFFKKKINGKYFIIKYHPINLIDERSSFYTKKKQLVNSINFVRSENFLSSIKAFIKIPNIFFIYSYSDLISFFYKSHKYVNIKSFNFFIKIFKKIKITKFDMIDDYRVMPLFINLCKIFSINITGYMHGRIVHNNNVHENYKFSKFITWSNYFKSQLLEINPNYKTKDIKINLNLKFKNNNINFKNVNCNKIKILIIQENEISLSSYKNIISKLINYRNLEIFFKFRPKIVPNKHLIKILTKNQIKYFHTENIKDIIVAYKINFFFGYNSTMLLDAIYYNVFPVSLCLNNKIRIDNNYFIIYNLYNIDKKLKNILRQKKFLKELKKKIWL